MDTADAAPPTEDGARSNADAAPATWTAEERRDHSLKLGLPPDPDLADWLMAMTPEQYHAERARNRWLIEQRLIYRKKLDRRLSPAQKRRFQRERWLYRDIELHLSQRATPVRRCERVEHARGGGRSPRAHAHRGPPASGDSDEPADDADPPLASRRARVAK